jgi:hypothetical protein
VLPLSGEKAVASCRCARQPPQKGCIHCNADPSKLVPVNEAFSCSNTVNVHRISVHNPAQKVPPTSGESDSSLKTTRDHGLTGRHHCIRAPEPHSRRHHGHRRDCKTDRQLQVPSAVHPCAPFRPDGLSSGNSMCSRRRRRRIGRQGSASATSHGPSDLQWMAAPG